MTSVKDPLQSLKQSWLLVFGLFAGCALCAGIYWPGLTDEFMLDDGPNLSLLARNAHLDTFERLKAFVLGGIAGPTGRPVALASFLLNDIHWPSRAGSFKYTNLMIHLLTAVVLMSFVRMLCTHVRSCKSHTAWQLSVLAGLLWALHPIMVSTVLYPVQRMTQLYTLFVLLAAICYVHGRRGIELSARVRSGWFFLIGGVGAFGLLAVGSKETAIVFPLLVLCIDKTILMDLGTSAGALNRRLWTAWRVAVVWLPIGVILGYHIVRWPTLGPRFSIFPFDAWERVLSQGRVLIDYLVTLALPRRQSLGLFQDDYVVSRGLFEPLTTVLAWLIVVALVFGAIRWRKRYPLAAFGILWFFAAHSLEASVLPIELYFEHRNYLPATGIAVLAAFGLIQLAGRIKRLAMVRAALPAVACLVLALVTFQNVGVWADPVLKSQLWYVDHPDSPRARDYFVDQMVSAGHPQLAMQALGKKLENNPDAIDWLAFTQLSCQLSGKVPDDWSGRVVAHIQGDYARQKAQYYLLNFLDYARDNRCRGLDNQQMLSVISSYLETDVYRQYRSQHINLLMFKSKAQTRIGELTAALETLNELDELADGVTGKFEKLLVQINLDQIDAAEATITDIRKNIDDTDPNAARHRAWSNQYDKVLAQMRSDRNPGNHAASTVDDTNPD